LFFIAILLEMSSIYPSYPYLGYLLRGRDDQAKPV